MSSTADRLRALAEPAVTSAGLVLEDLVVTPAGRRRLVRVVVDLPDHEVGGVPMESVTTASQALSAALDDSDVMGGSPYVLEVSSPGADRPLTERRHWLRARGRRVGVVIAGAPTVTGRLTTVDDDGIEVGGVRYLWGQVVSGRVDLEFAHSDSTPGPVSDHDDDDDDDDEGDDVDADDVDARADLDEENG